MAGGCGSRLNLGEKPLVSVCGKPMLSYVIEAFRTAGCEPVVVTSLNTPMTQNWCRAHDIPFFRSSGSGYIEDFVEAVTELEERNPLFISVCDIPCIDPDCIRAILHEYSVSGKEACSTWIPSTLMKACRESMPYREEINGIDACPAGVNILRGDRIDRPQQELKILSGNPRLCLNINTKQDLAEAELFMKNSS
jgi:adenosylcobinamide-phosphate guanylyltransferase